MSAAPTVTFEHLLLHHKLTGAANWRDWSHTVEFILAAEDLDEYISKDHVIPATTDESYKNWKRGNARACLIIMLNCTQEPRNLIMGLNSAKEMWARLQKFY